MALTSERYPIDFTRTKPYQYALHHTIPRKMYPFVTISGDWVEKLYLNATAREKIDGGVTR